MSHGHFPDFLDNDATTVAKRLLGCELMREIEGHTVRVRIIETESYDQTDGASHSYKGRTPRTEIMFGESGRLYVYFTYGMHYCCNVVTGALGEGSAVLIRAVEPLEGARLLEYRRNKIGVEATNGPAKLCQALDIGRVMNGHDLRQSPLRLVEKSQLPDESITTTTRIGISVAKDELRRFYITDSPYVSRR